MTKIKLCKSCRNKLFWDCSSQMIIMEETKGIEKPMNMNYREAYAKQRGWDKGFKANTIDMSKIDKVINKNKECFKNDIEMEWIRTKLKEELK
jgi:hypothetical protein